MNNVARLDMHDVAKVIVQQGQTMESAGREFTARAITIEQTDGTTVTIQLFATGTELKLEIK